MSQQLNTTFCFNQGLYLVLQFGTPIIPEPDLLTDNIGDYLTDNTPDNLTDN